MRHEADREPEGLCDLGNVLVAPDPVGGYVLENGAGVRARLQRPPGAGHARLRVDNDRVGVDRLTDREERQQYRGRVTPRVGDQPPLRCLDLRQAIAPAAEPVRLGMAESVPLL